MRGLELLAAFALLGVNVNVIWTPLCVGSYDPHEVFTMSDARPNIAWQRPGGEKV
jgi:hypothetical protein